MLNYKKSAITNLIFICYSTFLYLNHITFAYSKGEGAALKNTSKNK